MDDDEAEDGPEDEEEELELPPDVPAGPALEPVPESESGGLEAGLVDASSPQGGPT